MSRYTQDSWIIKGPGLPESGAVSVGVHELEAAFEAGRDMGNREGRTEYSMSVGCRCAHYS